jgi:hypothetical protein
VENSSKLTSWIVLMIYTQCMDISYGKKSHEINIIAIQTPAGYVTGKYHPKPKSKERGKSFF